MAAFDRVHVVVNPAAGRDTPILSTLSDVFGAHGVEWDVSVTHGPGEARDHAAEAAAAGYGLVAAYGGDGTQHEVANGVLGTDAVMGVLPGGTGNAFAAELGVPDDERAAVEVLCTSTRVRHLDVARIGDDVFVQRLVTGIEPEEQTPREMKDRFGLLAYGLGLWGQLRGAVPVRYRLRVDDEDFEEDALRLYVANTGRTGTGIQLAEAMSPDDGLLDVFLLDKSLDKIVPAVHRVLHLETEQADLYHWRGRRIEVDADPSQCVWVDGEEAGRTPFKVTVEPGALRVLVP